MSGKNALEPCPFCGSTNLILKQSTHDREGVPCAVLCDDCGANGPWNYVHERVMIVCEATGGIPLEVIELWNGRKQSLTAKEVAK